MKRTLIVLTSLLIIAAFGYAFANSQNLGGVFRTATPTVTSPPTATNTSTPTLTLTITFTQTPTYTPLPTFTNTPLPSTKNPKNNIGESGSDNGSENPCEPYPWCEGGGGTE